jgi:hypothetical protein
MRLQLERSQPEDMLHLASATVALSQLYPPCARPLGAALIYQTAEVARWLSLDTIGAVLWAASHAAAGSK